MDDDTALSLFTVYDHPLDYPDCFVVREFRVSETGTYPVDPPMLFPSLDAARQSQMDRWRTCMIRQAGDDPKIVETWI